jgi:hypothetical protein
MDPATIRRADQTARFLARGAVDRGGIPLPDRFAGHVGARVWGIAVEIEARADEDDRAEAMLDVTLDDGRMLTASLAEPLLAGDPAAVLANARYWELPPAHVALLAAALNVVEEE